MDAVSYNILKKGINSAYRRPVLAQTSVAFFLYDNIKLLLKKFQKIEITID